MIAVAHVKALIACHLYGEPQVKIHVTLTVTTDTD
jgi:hypothetical protein